MQDSSLYRRLDESTRYFMHKCEFCLTIKLKVTLLEECLTHFLLPAAPSNNLCKLKHFVSILENLSLINYIMNMKKHHPHGRRTLSCCWCCCCYCWCCCYGCELSFFSHFLVLLIVKMLSQFFVEVQQSHLQMESAKVGVVRFQSFLYPDQA